MNNPAVKTALDSMLRDSGIALRRTTLEVVQYADQRSAHLSAIAGEAGFDEALAAEARNVAQFAGIEAARLGDAADAAARARVFGLIYGVLAAGA